jgi:galactonate dehydratase
MTKKIVRHSRDIKSYCDSAAEIREAGYTALKFGPAPYTHYDTLASEVRHTGELLQAVRETVGPDMDIMLDLHGRPATMEAAIANIDAVAPARPMFVEEPVQPGDPEAMRMISQKVSVPIATGERLLTHKEFENLCNLKAVTYVQPDLCHCGGFTVGKQIAATAAANYIGVCPHNPMGPIAGAVGLHFGVAVPNFVVLEEVTGSIPWYHDVVSTPINRVDGFWEVPTTPGLGVEIDETEAARHPFEQEQIAATAAANYIGVCPHNPMGPIAGAVGLHYGVAVPNFVILEEITGAIPWYDEVVSTPIRRVDGFWQVPTAPGLGVEIDEAAAARHPFEQEKIAGLEAVVRRDGTIANW